MLTNICRRATLQRAIQTRGFAALNETSINLSSVNPSDIHDSSPSAVGALMAEMVRGQAPNQQELADELEEYFRKRFRRVSFTDASKIMMSIGHPFEQKESLPQKSPELDDKFWIWETLEEATRGECQTLGEQDFEKFATGWYAQQKGTMDLHDQIE